VRAVTFAITATGEVVAPDDGVARVGARLAGRVTHVAAGVGDAVRPGATLATLTSPELGRAKADYLVASTAARVTRETADRERALFDQQIAAESAWQLAEGEAAKARAEKEAAELRLHTLGLSDAQLARLSPDDHLDAAVRVTSPIGGVVVERDASLGQTVDPQDTMFVIMDLATVWIVVDVYEGDLAQVAVDQPVDATVAAWGERAFRGTIASVGAVLDRRSRTVKARVVVPNPDGALKPGMFAAVTLAGTTAAPRDGLFVPASAAQRDGDGWVVFVPVADATFQRRPVELRPIGDAGYEVVAGLARGERVVTRGTFLLESEARGDDLGEHDH
ncbi:MAG: efflux RND transporter periplasmic adaptor subunit, partial [Myxococcales bacterium]|nr:efflux RND transporter periplasmic adaptor subunit [Myxococcales bacterium]